MVSHTILLFTQTCNCVPNIRLGGSLRFLIKTHPAWIAFKMSHLYPPGFLMVKNNLQSEQYEQLTKTTHTELACWPLQRLAPDA
jgi:hypothetical protein